MTKVDPKIELFAEGLKSYPAAREAIRAFEELVGELALQVMVRHLDDLKRATGQPGITEHDIKVERDLVPPPAVGVGAVCGAPETWGIRWGIKWVPPQPSRSARLEAFMGVRVRAAYIQDYILRNLQSVISDEKDQGVSIEKVSGWGHEVHVSTPMTPDLSLEEAEKLIDKVVSFFLNMANRAGGISALLAAPTTSND
ncbi:hypothetical protein G7K71_04065 [Desulfofundulus sp. TPOSR]|jgi:hypothetical protein|uniref:hypothetical protein n=1 Tax=Desulfofundulus sp. TPOSR TaxID=2714340 RepID=UPI001407406F|nr:hypothetical protein [Desulfofundulus sp. TPOSR]NHM26189.1 hypothetical protein [Desulfofundulus sp. TPOSR]